MKLREEAVVGSWSCLLGSQPWAQHPSAVYGAEDVLQGHSGPLCGPGKVGRYPRELRQDGA